MTATTLRRPLFGPYPVTPLNDDGAPPFAAFEADQDEESRGETLSLDYEASPADWAPVAPGPPPADAPLRFIDGSIASRTAGQIVVGGRRRPLIAGVVAAASLQLESRAMRRPDPPRTRKILCLHSDGIERGLLDIASAALATIGVDLQEREAESAVADFDAMRRAVRAIAMEAMEHAERDVLLADLATPTLVDGLLERRLAGVPSHNVPAFGLVKRQIATYLPLGLQELAYALRPGERTPAFVLRTVQHVDLVNTYVRLSAEPGTSPSYGIVRLTAPLAYVDANHPGPAKTAWLSGLAGYVHRLRHRDLAYGRAGISVEPIVRVEDHLHALRPDIDVLVRRLHRLFAMAEAA